LIVTATHGGAILFWDSLPTTDNQLPSYTIKLSQFGTLRNISTDGSTYLFVGDHNAKIVAGQSRSGTFFWNTFPTQSNQSYDWFFEEWIKGITTQDGKLIAGGLSSVYIWNSFPTSSNILPNVILRNNYYSNGDGPDVVIAGGRMFVNNYNGNNVHVYDSIPTQATQLPNFALGSPSIEYNTLDSIHYIQNPVVESDGEILIATSDFDRSLWIWKTVNPVSGQAPDVNIYLRGPLDLAPWDNALFNNKFIAVGRTRAAVWDLIPVNGEPPSKIFSNNIGNAQLTDLTGVALDSSFLYLGERNGKIYLWRGIPTSNTQNPDTTFTIPEQPLNKLHSDGIYLTATIQNAPPSIYIYRVSDLESGNYQPYKVVTRSSQLPLNLCASAIAFNGSFAIANTNGHSVLLWKNIEDAGDPTKVIILGQDSLQATNPAIGINRLFMPASLCASRNHLWVGEFKFSSRILRFSYNIQSNKDIAVSEGWNLVSVPLELADMNTSILFPSAVSKTFGYIGGYYSTTVLENGKGYWLKFNSPDTLRFTGNVLSRNIPISKGWNIIGVYNENIPTNQITTTPADIITSPFFGYNNGYFAASDLETGKSYWVKANNDGVIQTGSNVKSKMYRSIRTKK
ncbi:MAG TPA: hypothetical protein VFF29_04735, partial [Bacteroidota bacterium]|nr:hypothetical protein [Bacteroidota bacterium]